MLVIRPATFDDCAELAVTMRQEDLAELRAASGKDPLAALFFGVEHSEDCKTALLDGRVMAIWGVVPVAGSVLSGRVGNAWLLTSPLVDLYPKLFMRHCKRELQALKSRWLDMQNAIDCRHTKALRWAKHLGFSMAEPAPFGVLGLPFVRFSVAQEMSHV